ncbi:MAG: hemerythrin [Gallionellaceae bacterium]|nr:MAG: hemerythrin [Gallionellaceae bacterium]
MSNINWTDDLNIGIESIDEQHRHIVSLFNELNDAHIHGEINVANKLLTELIEFKVFHCAHEEDLLKQSGFPLYKMHKLSHELIINQCLVLHQRAENGEYVVKEAVPFLRATLVSHIKGEDADYAIYVRQSQRSGQKEGRGWFSSLKRLFR